MSFQKYKIILHLLDVFANRDQKYQQSAKLIVNSISATTTNAHWHIITGTIRLTWILGVCWWLHLGKTMTSTLPFQQGSAGTLVWWNLGSLAWKEKTTTYTTIIYLQLKTTAASDIFAVALHDDYWKLSIKMIRLNILLTTLKSKETVCFSFVLISTDKY